MGNCVSVGIETDANGRPLAESEELRQAATPPPTKEAKAAATAVPGDRFDKLCISSAFCLGIYDGAEHQQGTYHRRGLTACYRFELLCPVAGAAATCSPTLAAAVVARTATATTAAVVTTAI